MVLDPGATLSSENALFRETAGRAAVFVGADVEEAELERLERAGAVVHPVPRGLHGLDLGAVLDVAGGLGIRSLLCEGGGRLASSFLDEGLVQRVYLVHAPIALGAGAVPGFPGPFSPGTWDGWSLAFPPEQLGRDVLAVYEREE